MWSGCFQNILLFGVLCLTRPSEAKPPLGNDRVHDKPPILLYAVPIEWVNDVQIEGAQHDSLQLGIDTSDSHDTTNKLKNEEGVLKINLPITNVEKIQNDDDTLLKEEIRFDVDPAKRERDAIVFMQNINEESSREENILKLKRWDYENNVTETTKQNFVKAQNTFGNYEKDRWNKIQEWETQWPNFTNESLKRQFKLFSVLGVAALPEEKFKKFTELKTEMKDLYSSTKICAYNQPEKCDLAFEPDIDYIMKHSRDFDELAHTWKAWRDAAGKPLRNTYSQYAKLLNEAAILNDFSSAAEMWTHPFESETFEQDMMDMYNQLTPLYKQLHAYTRRKLREIYGEDLIPKRGPIPAHVTGNMWAQTWENIFHLLIPYKNKPFIGDVTHNMKQKGYTPRLMFEKADDFFASMGLERVPSSFWEKSVLEKPKDRKIICHASAWDLEDRKDFRIKQCTDVDMEEFFTVHHELGHVQYFIQYKHLPYIFRYGGNPGFHEAVGDVLSLSVSTPKHLVKVGLLEPHETDMEADINFLLESALRRVAFLPFGYLVDRYRWDVFRGDITPENYTKSWWNYRHKLQGVAPPVVRSEEDFDPAAKFHVAGDVKYIRYFASAILQFQFYKAACLSAKEYDPNDPLKPLHQCDIYQSKEAGKVLGDMLKVGVSQHWSKTLKDSTGSEKMNVSALIEYFRPLEKWLIKNNERNGEFIGWDGEYDQLLKESEEKTLDKSNLKEEIRSTEKEKNIVTPNKEIINSEVEIITLGREHNSTYGNMTEKDAQLFMKQINRESSEISNNFSNLNWNYQTNITEINKNKLIEATKEYGEFSKKRWNRVQQWKTKWPNFQNKTLKRQFKFYKLLGKAALSKEKYENFTVIKTEMGEIYGTAKICDFKNTSKCDIPLDPGIKNILKSSRDYDELIHVWKAWRDKAGKPSRNLFTKLAELSNEVAVLNGFSTDAEMQMHGYESETFEEDVLRIFDELSPLYKQLHAYTRRKLREIYGESRIPKRGPLPAHVTGNMWAQTWENLYDILVPYPNKTFVDVTDKLVEQGYTPRLMFEKADDFFASMNLERVPPLFWNKSVIERPDGREISCHATAWDFANGKDFRIKQCAKIEMTDFFTIHHEMGHIQYYMQYKDLPYVFRSGANPGFHEAIGDVLSLSVSTPKHLHKIGLLETYETDNETDINFLLKSALRKVTFLPSAYLIDKYRWEIYRGNITPNNYTKSWWKLWYEFQGIVPPVERTENDFDPAAKFHVSNDYGYIQYFVAAILQFQFHKAACLLAKEYDPNDPLKPLHRCDIYQSTEAGNALKEMMKVGSSVHWKEPLKAFTRSETIDASALREYFSPLEEWLIKNNEQNGEFVGWEGGYEHMIQSDDETIASLNTKQNENPIKEIIDIPISTKESKLPIVKHISSLVKDETLLSVSPAKDVSSNTEKDTKILEESSSVPVLAKENKSTVEESSDISIPSKENEPSIVKQKSFMTEDDAKIFINKINEESYIKQNNYTFKAWNFQTNITDYNKQKLIEGKNYLGEFSKNRWKRIQEWKTKWPIFGNQTLKRQFQLFSVLGEAALPKDQLEELNTITTEMREIYSTAKICDYKDKSKCQLSFNPEISDIMKKSRDYDELLYVWEAWRDTVGVPLRNLYPKFVTLSNEAAVLNGFPSTAEMWMYDYESETFEQDIAHLYEQLRPLYEHLHAYTRRKLRQVYGESKVPKSGPIPAHITGNMWAQSWENLYDILVPYPNKTSIDVSDAMIKQGYTPRLMFEKADEFFASLGLERVPESFWNNSIIEKPNDRDIVCHANAWDFYDGKDFRIKQCTRVNMDDFFVVHHELGHVQYYMQYKNLPFKFRRGANPGFHEAVGDVISLSVATPKHLHKIGLLETYETDEEADINFLLKTALDKVAFLPFAYLVDLYRWKIFRGNISHDVYSEAWLNLRHDLQGVSSPIPRTEVHMDAASKSHIPSNTRYIRYFVARILQFQFHKGACLLANEYDPNDQTKPLHRCDIYESKEAGKAIKDMLKLGTSMHWSKPLKALTGSDVIDASALREYFRPLELWLIDNNKKHDENIGWKVERK